MKRLDEDEVFLRRFRIHVEAFLKSKEITKEAIIGNIRVGDCPFKLDSYEKLGTKYPGIFRGKLVHRYQANNIFRLNMDFPWRSHELEQKMIGIVEEVNDEKV